MYKKTKKPAPKVINEISNAKTDINLVFIRFGNLLKIKFLSNMVVFMKNYLNYLTTDTKLEKIKLQ